MPNILTADAVDRYAQTGYLFPLPVLNEAEVATCRGHLEAFETAQGEPISGAYRNKSHLLFKWIDDLMRHERILDAMEDLIGPDLLCWNTLFWVNEGGSKSFVSWHQDLRYWGLDTHNLITVWLALLPATEEKWLHARSARQPCGRDVAGQWQRASARDLS